MSAYAGLQTPRGHQSILIEPSPPSLLRDLRTANVEHTAGAPLLDTDVLDARRCLRERLGLSGPVILTGHQAEFFHAGVFAKSIAADAIAAATHGQSVYITVDTDTPKTAHLMAPTIEADVVRRRAALIPSLDAAIPMNAQPALANSAWRAFFADVRTGIPAADTTLFDVYQQGWFAGSGPMVDSCAAFMRANAACEHTLGFQHAPQLRTSELSAWPEFRAFVAHLAANAAAFRSAYNESQAAYRARRRVRSPLRPVPPLAEIDGRCELPFWIVRADAPRRRLFVCRHGEHLAFFADAEHVGNECARDLGRWERHAAPWAIEDAGWRILPRALTLSAFCRLCLSDLFIHGIGGAKYDEMTEAFVTRFWGIQAPPTACVTASLHLELPAAPEAEAAVRSARRNARDIRFNPQRHADGLPADLLAERKRLIDEAIRLAREDRHNRAERHAVFKSIRNANAKLVALAGSTQRALQDAVAAAERRFDSHKQAIDREFFYAMHQRPHLQTLADAVRRHFAT
jgi:hypothetical protein